jgi:hypothetical protein
MKNEDSKSDVMIENLNSTKIRNPWIAVILSFFFVGWGQWYNGKTWDGLKFFGMSLGTYLLLRICFIIGLSQLLIGILILVLFVILIGIWIYGMYDAYKIADRINKRDESFVGKSRLFWIPTIIFALLVFIILAAIISYIVLSSPGFFTPV